MDGWTDGRMNGDKIGDRGGRGNCIGDRMNEGETDRNGYGIDFRCLRGKIGHLYRTLTPTGG